MLLSLCHNQIVGFLYSVARILEPKLCTYSVAGDKISVSLKISIQLLNRYRSAIAKTTLEKGQG